MAYIFDSPGQAQPLKPLIAIENGAYSDSGTAGEEV